MGMHPLNGDAMLCAVQVQLMINMVIVTIFFITVVGNF